MKHSEPNLLKEQALKKEVRTVTLTELRITDDSSEPIIQGHAAVFDSWSETLGYMFPFKEKVLKGAFSKSIQSDDIRALFNHDPNFILGRNLAKTLCLQEDEKGLFVTIKPPQTSYAKDLVTSIKRGDITQMSFGFVVLDEQWSEENGTDIRELKEVKLFDVSPVTFPAYPETDVNIRAMQSYTEHRQKISNKELEQEKQETQKILDSQEMYHLKTKFKNI